MASQSSINVEGGINSVVDPQNSQRLIDAITPCWQNVGRRLGIDNSKLDQLKNDKSVEGEKAKCTEMIRIFREVNGEKATHGLLQKALREEIFEASAKHGQDRGFDDDTASPEVAPQAVPSTALLLPRYNMVKTPFLGKCLILTYGEFDKNKYGDLKGIKVDEENLKGTFTTLGYEVESYSNLGKNESMQHIETMAQNTDDSFVLFVSSHGTEESFITRDNQEIALQDVITPFNADKCRGFAGKPKMFFFNTCRGTAEDKMVKMSGSGTDMKRGVGSNLSYYRPTQADFCVVLSSVSGFVSWHDENKGSCFVRCITTTLTKHYKNHHLIDMFTMSNDTLLREFEEMEKRKSSTSGSICQVPTIISTLSKAVYFLD